MEIGKLYEIIDEYWKDFINKKELKGVCNDSIPIIWFGDIKSYFLSDIKTVTIGLNPSNSEFMNDNKEKDLTFRFNEAKEFIDKEFLDKNDKDELIAMYNKYFKKNPYYTKWFQYYDKKVLELLACEQGYDVGYNTKYDNVSHKNTAIHIDCYSAIATDPVWSGLTTDDQYKETVEKLKNLRLFIKFLEYLNPDVILFSCAYDSFFESMKMYDENVELIPDVCQVDDYPKHKGKINSFIIRDKLVIHGRYKSTPFTPISDVEKKEIFEKIFRTYIRECDECGSERITRWKRR